METIALPLQFSNGRAVVHSDDTDDYYAHILAMCISIEPDELPLTPNFGVNDPTFASVTRASIVELAARYVPEITITSIDSLIEESGQNAIEINFFR